MAKVNEFEKGKHIGAQVVKRFSEEATMHYTYPSADKLVETSDDLAKMIQHHQDKQRPRLKELRDYYEGQNTRILRGKRRLEDHLADNRAVHNYAEYVSGFIQGYLVGVPIKTTYEDDESVEKKIRDINRTNDADEHNSELVLDQSIFGRAYELLYRSKDDKTRFTVSDVLETFVIYDDTVEMNPIAGVRYIYNRFSEETTVYLYTSNRVITYTLGDDFKLSHVDNQSHSFNGVPIIEYSNNRFRRGDFERVLSLIDLYDEAQSDTANYMTDVNDALLVLKGRLDMGEQLEENELEFIQEMKEANTLYLEPSLDSDGKEGGVDAFYIYKQYDVSGTEAYKDRLANDIHMFTYTPNMSDEHFASNQSGQALRYKLFGLEQKCATKERLFKKSLRDRYRLINNIMQMASEGGFEVNDIGITFTPNLPNDLLEDIRAFSEVGGVLSEETALTLLPIVENPQEEMDKIRAGRTERARLESQRTNPYPLLGEGEEDEVDG